ncbi:hypothetical protein [Streptomyces sp. CC224B]|uniref:hypothetical protein n=1 Tax=Streptomyces sp. CC224B TaxID=3044571 RepID=UPI0024A80A21|nr:hypothetical protein [Streptomyces sp. CC224B]
MATTMVSAVAAAPYAIASDAPEVRVSRYADRTTAAVAQADRQAVEAAATVCGAGYTLRKAVPLPVGDHPDERLGTLFAYEKGSNGCLILDNNVGSKQYMYLKVCKVGGGSCDTDSGNFTDYAGPVRVSSFSCAPVTAKMASTSSSTPYINYKSEYVYPCG